MKKQIDNPNQTTHCAKCNRVIALVAGDFPNHPLAWFDPYCKTHYRIKGHKGAYVCKIHLSKQRTIEVAIAEKCYIYKP